jgi:hypothetical protein
MYRVEVGVLGRGESGVKEGRECREGRGEVVWVGAWRVGREGRREGGSTNASKIPLDY